ncbi:MAG: ATP-binding protein [Actinomycetales bacterium]
MLSPIPRLAQATLDRLSRGFPVLWITGPRQSGKTTLSQTARPDLPYVNLERPDERAFATNDPRGLLAAYPDGAILDEIQYAPELTSWLQVHVDQDKRMGRWLLTGSQQPAIAQGVVQSLAGRVGRVELLPLSGRELASVDLLPDTLDNLLYTGGYPALFDRDISPTDWLGNYFATYVERDVRLLTAVQQMDTFVRFVRLCAARSGQLLNMSSLGNDAGISLTTVRNWLSVLRATYVLDLVEPYSPNVTSRLVKSPKLVFLDVGLMAYLVGINHPTQVMAHPLRGSLFETWGITERIKAWRNAGQTQRAMFLRDRRAAEIDLVFAEDNAVHGIEFKSGATISNDWAKSIDLWRGRTQEPWAKPMVVYGGAEDSRRSDVDFICWRSYARDLGN